MKNMTLFLILLITYLFYSTSVASHIKPTASLAFSGRTFLSTPLTISSTLSKDNSKKTTRSLVDQEEVNLDDKTFDQELQWRILNLLAQQLFQSDNDPLANDLFTNHWLYSTQTFSVDISSINPDFYLVKIIDSQLGSETQLEIPRL